MKKVEQSKLMDTLYKKALGYNVEEIVEEYSGDEKGGELIKKKVTRKPVPPDMAALKEYLNLLGERKDFEDLSDAELLAEKVRVIKEMNSKKD